MFNATNELPSFDNDFSGLDIYKAYSKLIHNEVYLDVIAYREESLAAEAITYAMKNTFTEEDRLIINTYAALSKNHEYSRFQLYYLLASALSVRYECIAQAMDLRIVWTINYVVKFRREQYSDLVIMSAFLSDHTKRVLIQHDFIKREQCIAEYSRMVKIWNLSRANIIDINRWIAIKQ